MESKRAKGPMIEARVGFAADERGHGVAYVSLTSGQKAKSVRVPFTVRRYPALLEREVGYAAITAVAGTVAGMGCRRVTFHLADERVVEDVRERRDVPMPLAIEYVRLGCALNRFAEFRLESDSGPAQDLTARARAEVTLHVAA
ncbi:MAG: hypothetical protein M3N19_09790 [Candidatus Eremiobacteraeota bacterium]|nr:hypothetical protein [Candidatus Eremiobacteraeota bacterium]